MAGPHNREGGAAPGCGALISSTGKSSGPHSYHEVRPHRALPSARPGACDIVCGNFPPSGIARFALCVSSRGGCREAAAVVRWPVQGMPCVMGNGARLRIGVPCTGQVARHELESSGNVGSAGA